MKGSTSQGFKDYLTVYDGKFAKRVSAPNDDTVTRTNKVGNEVHEIYYNFIAGKITGLEKRDSEYGFNLVINIDDVDEKNEVMLKFYDRATRTILNKLCNVDFAKDATVLVGKNDEGYTWFSIKQAGCGYEKDIVPNKYTREEVPQPQKIKVQGKDTWNFDEQNDFLWDNALKNFQSQGAKPVVEATVEAAEDDDLPF